VFEQQALQQTNIDRATNCASPLTISANVTLIAQTYAQYLCDTQTFVHSSNTYQGQTLGENLWTISSSDVIDPTTIDGKFNLKRVHSYYFLF
jgi:hypothetical protein